ncbi:MAG: c-type cytochrome [Methylococcales bacterium]|nr:c-type cytochrome [Methylococcales bacterium]
MKKSLLLAISLAFASNATILHAMGNISAGKEKSASCAGCHGDDGNSPASAFPKLAGQHASYLTKQLLAFKSADRNDAMMAPMAASLSEEDIHDLAAFYAAAKVTPNPAPEIDKSIDAAAQKSATEEMDKLVAEGRNLYRNGDINAQVSACIACHGPFGDGNKPASYPLLKSQHADYIVKTLTDFKNGERSKNPDNMMNMIAKKMSEREIKAIAYYLSLQK